MQVPSQFDSDLAYEEAQRKCAWCEQKIYHGAIGKFCSVACADEAAQVRTLAGNQQYITLREVTE